MQKITYITDPEVLAIPIIESGEPIIDIKNETTLLYGEPPECEATKDCYTKMRQSVYEKLCAAQNDLPKGYRFRLYEGFRSIAVQQMLFDNEHKRVLAQFPDASPAFIFHETTRLVSPVINADGSKNTPAHNTGGAVDVEIIDDKGELLDMGMTAKDWCVVDPDLCLTHYDKLSDTVKQNRLLLLNIMRQHNFVNYPTEWWHFSYGDRYWAYHAGAEKAIYGSADHLT